MVAALGDRGRDPLATLAALASSLVAALAEEVFVSARYALAAVEESAAEKVLQTLRRRRLSQHSTCSLAASLAE